MKENDFPQQSEKILVTGAAGKTGYATALELLARGKQVRAFVRRKSERSASLQAAGAEIFEGDLSDYVDVSKALTDIQKAYFIAPWVPAQLHIATTFAVAAAESDLKLIVAITQWLAQPQHPSLATRQSYLTDRLFDRLPGIDVVKINSGWFADNFLRPELLAMVTQLGIFPFPLGEGRTAPVSNEDIGRVAAEALINPLSYIGKTLRPTGPVLMSPQDLADALGRAAGREVKYANISDWLFRKAMRFMAMPAHMQAQVRRYVEDYRLGGFEVGAPNSVVLEMTGEEAEDFETIARRYISHYAEFTEPKFVNKLKAISGFMQLAMTRPFDLDRFEKERVYPAPVHPLYSIDQASWMQSHRQQHARMTRALHQVQNG
ncbi:MAG: NmrA family NAD(P)-binding protein [Candidatus Thiodiazotropha sp.]